MRIALVASLLVSLTAQPTQAADVTARYALSGPLGPDMIIQADENGDARIDMRGRRVAIRRGGVIYLVRDDNQGVFVLALSEFQRIEARKRMDDGRQSFTLPEGMEPLGSLRLVEGEPQMVGGRSGISLTLEMEGEDPDGDHPFVVSTDADLRTVGEMLAATFARSDTGLGPEAIVRMINEVFSRGAVIRLPGIFELQSTSSEDVPATAFELPGPVVSGEEAEARLGRAW